jgi:hypothetical protein
VFVHFRNRSKREFGISGQRLNTRLEFRGEASLENNMGIVTTPDDGFNVRGRIAFYMFCRILSRSHDPDDGEG